MDNRTCRYCGVAITGRQQTKCTAPKCRRAYNNERTARFNAKWKQEHGQRHGVKYNATRKQTSRLRWCEACGREYRTTRAGGRVCSLGCRWFIDPRIAKSSPLDWHACRCGRWLSRPAQRSCGRRLCRPPASVPAPKLFACGICGRCGAGFTILLTGTFPLYCSMRCSRAEAKTRRRMLERSNRTEPVNRTKVFQRDRWRCQICGKAVRRAAIAPHPKAPVLDHIVPLSKGGRHEYRNVQCAHFLCNSVKSAGGTDQLLLFG
jgi:5-methylcytosine-specific restriction endonuclease McrA